ncbi:M42 family peptidase [Candidatus Palauibacter sp.]|uniref:M42 family peptidase n=1 Tax=Candidatus Palauibacter sp. TaxID=3101350 RepID=UPI003AF30654
MQQLKQTLLRLLDAPGPSGFENAASEVWRDIAREFADDVWTDVQGNSFASNAAEGAPTVMLAGHVDEIGIMVHYIDDEGFLYVRGVGGWDAQVLVGQRIELLTRDGPLPGVVGRKAIHLMKPEERTQAVKLSDLWLDIGAASGDDARRLVAIGDVGTIRSETVIIGDTIVVARSVDDRSGTAVVLEALRRLCGRPIAPRVVAVATTHEEIGAHLGGGARTSSFQLNPEVAIVLDVTHATDHPHADKREYGDVRLGCGPVLSRGAVLNPRLVDGLEERGSAGRHGHPVAGDTLGHRDRCG